MVSRRLAFSRSRAAEASVRQRKSGQRQPAYALASTLSSDVNPNPLTNSQQAQPAHAECCCVEWQLNTVVQQDAAAVGHSVVRPDGCLHTRDTSRRETPKLLARPRCVAQRLAIWRRSDRKPCLRRAEAKARLRSPRRLR